jgi:hypothetical protein
MGEQKAKPVFGVPEPQQLCPLAADLIGARRRLHMAVRDFARDRLEISEDALRDIEAGRTKQPRRETLIRILTWARRRGYQQFGGYLLTKGDLPGPVPPCGWLRTGCRARLSPLSFRYLLTAHVNGQVRDRLQPRAESQAFCRESIFFIPPARSA